MKVGIRGAKPTIFVCPRFRQTAKPELTFSLSSGDISPTFLSNPLVVGGHHHRLPNAIIARWPLPVPFVNYDLPEWTRRESERGGAYHHFGSCRLACRAHIKIEICTNHDDKRRRRLRRSLLVLSRVLSIGDVQKID